MARAELAVSAVREVLAVPVALVELVAPAVRAELATVPRNYQREEAELAIDLRNNRRAEAVIDGSTTLNIGEAHRTGIGQPQTDLGARRAGDSLANRQAGARQQLGRQGGNVAGNRTVRAQFEQPVWQLWAWRRCRWRRSRQQERCGRSGSDRKPGSFAKRRRKP